MRSAMILSLLGVASCASAPIASSEGRAVLGTAAEGGLHISGDEAKMAMVAFPMTRVWGILPMVYDSLGIKVGDVDPDKRVLGNSQIKATRQLAKVPLSKYLDCGNAQGFPSADTYLVQMSVLTHLAEDKSGLTSISTVIQASARPMQFAGESVRCTTKYTLETAIVDGIKARLR
jgi:hypothetical protein